MKQSQSKAKKPKGRTRAAIKAGRQIEEKNPVDREDETPGPGNQAREGVEEGHWADLDDEDKGQSPSMANH